MSSPAACVDLYAGHGVRLAVAIALATAAESAGFGGLWTLEAHTEPFLPLVLAAEHTDDHRVAGQGHGDCRAQLDPGERERVADIEAWAVIAGQSVVPVAVNGAPGLAIAEPDGMLRARGSPARSQPIFHK